MSSALEFLLGAETVSLNHLWTTSSPRLDLNPPYNISSFYTHEGTLGSFPDGLSASSVQLQFSGQHGAPTIDAIGHIAVNGTAFGGVPIGDIQSDKGLLKMGIEEYPEDKYTNRGILVDMPYCKEVEMLSENTIITQADVVECLEKQGGLEIKDGDSVLIRTGYGALFASDTDSYTTNYPGPSAEVATYLAEKKVFLTGADNLSWDAANTPFPAHVILIPENGIYIVENMNLEALAKTCQDKKTWEFALVMNPPKIQGAAAAAANSFAMFPGELPATSSAYDIGGTGEGLVGLFFVVVLALFH